VRRGEWFEKGGIGSVGDERRPILIVFDLMVKPHSGDAEEDEPSQRLDPRRLVVRTLDRPVELRDVAADHTVDPGEI